MKSLTKNLTAISLKEINLIFLIIVVSFSFISTVSAQSLGYKLAIIEKNGGYVTENDMLVKRFNSLLKLLDGKYVGGKQQIADGTVKASQLLEKNGIHESMINIMEGMNKIYDLNNPYPKYNTYLPCYVIFRINGYNHEESLSLLQESINTYGIKGLLKKLTGK